MSLWRHDWLECFVSSSKVRAKLRALDASVNGMLR
jgi:hypothetical protein